MNMSEGGGHSGAAGQQRCQRREDMVARAWGLWQPNIGWGK